MDLELSVLTTTLPQDPFIYMPIPVAERSKAWVCSHSPAETEKVSDFFGSSKESQKVHRPVKGLLSDEKNDVLTEFTLL
jgi:hypothetical protein